MKNNFALPSGNYNIVLSKEDLEQLVDKGYITKRPSRVDTTFVDEYGHERDVPSHDLLYDDIRGKKCVQFLSISLEK